MLCSSAALGVIEADAPESHSHASCSDPLVPVPVSADSMATEAVSTCARLTFALVSAFGVVDSGLPWSAQHLSMT